MRTGHGQRPALTVQLQLHQIVLGDHNRIAISTGIEHGNPSLDEMRSTRHSISVLVRAVRVTLHRRRADAEEQPWLR